METREHVLTRENLAPPLTPARARAHSVGQLATPGITTRRGSVGQLATPGAHAPGRGSVLALRRAGRELHELAPSDAARARAPCSSNAARARERRAGSAPSARRDRGSRGLTRATGTRATASSRPSDAVRARAPCSSNAARARECLRIERRSESVGSELACRQGRRQTKTTNWNENDECAISRTRGWRRGELEKSRTRAMRTRHGLAAHSMTTHRQMEVRICGLRGGASQLGVSPRAGRDAGRPNNQLE